MVDATDDGIEELSASECLALLRTVDLGRVAVNTADGGVDIFPINYVVDHGAVVFRTAPGTKLELIAAATRVAFEADHFDWYDGLAWSVVIKGEAALVTDRSDLLDLFDTDVQPWHPARKPHFVRLEASIITGRRFAVTRTARR